MQQTVLYVKDFLMLSFIYLFFLFCHSQSSRLPGSAGGMGYWAVVPIHIYEHAAMGKWSGFILYLFNCFLFSGELVHLNISNILVVPDTCSHCHYLIMWVFHEVARRLSFSLFVDFSTSSLGCSSF